MPLDPSLEPWAKEHQGRCTSLHVELGQMQHQRRLFTHQRCSGTLHVRPLQAYKISRFS